MTLDTADERALWERVYLASPTACPALKADAAVEEYRDRLPGAPDDDDDEVARTFAANVRRSLYTYSTSHTDCWVGEAFLRLGRSSKTECADTVAALILASCAGRLPSGDAPPDKAIFSVRQAIAETNLPPDTGSAEAIRELWALVLFRENEVAVMHGEATRLREESTKGGDAPQPSKPDADGRRWWADAGRGPAEHESMAAARLAAEDGLTECYESGWPLGTEYICWGELLVTHEATRDGDGYVLEASRPPGVAEPDHVRPDSTLGHASKRDAVEVAAEVLRAHLVMGSTQWAAMNTLLDIVHAYGPWASEGAAPPSEPPATECSNPAKVIGPNQSDRSEPTCIQAPDDGLRKRLEALAVKFEAEVKVARKGGLKSASRAIADAARMLRAALEGGS